ncbi:MAG: CBS domain-containing protein [Candidatus Bathyarchaeota archaeon]|nr:CBS domain-containing protein [Candidatus Bathyarchaeota archaeon]
MTKTLVELAETDVSSLLRGHGSVFSPGDQASKVLGVLKDTGRREAVAEEGNRVGIITVRNLLEVDQPERTKVESIWEQTGAISPDVSVLEAADVLLRNGVRAIPIVDRGKVTGIISQVDIADAMMDIPELKSIKAKELITINVETMDADSSITRARRLMLNKGISHIPVTRNGKLKGIVTAETIVHTFIAPATKTTRGARGGRKVNRFPGQLSGIMDTEPFTVGTEANVYEVVQGFAKTGKSACIMVDEKQVVRGIITPKEFITLIGELRGEDVMPVYILGITDEDFFERAVAEEKVRRAVTRSMKIHPDITEVNIRVKKQRTKGERTWYQITGRVTGPTTSFNTENEGWGLVETFDGLVKSLGETLRRAKKQPQKKTRRGRRRPNPHLKP